MKLRLAIVVLVAACGSDAPPSAPEPSAEGSIPVPEQVAAPSPKRPIEAEPASPKVDLGAAPAGDDADADADADLPGAHVVLPDKPTFPQVQFPARYADGSWSIAGLRADLDANVANGERGVEVIVRATVQEAYVKPECADAASCPRAKQPHAWLVDDGADKGKRNSMLVVNYAFAIPEWDQKRWAGQPEVELEVGKTYRVKGFFKRFTDTGFAHDQGLLEFRSIERIGSDGTTSWIDPPGAPWHPLEATHPSHATP